MKRQTHTAETAKPSISTRLPEDTTVIVTVPVCTDANGAIWINDCLTVVEEVRLTCRSSVPFHAISMVPAVGALVASYASLFACTLPMVSLAPFVDEAV